MSALIRCLTAKMDSTNTVSIKEYVDERLRAQEKAVEAALAALNRAATKDDAKISLFLSTAALLTSIASFVYMMSRK